MITNGIVTINGKEYKLGENLKVMGDMIFAESNKKGYYAEEQDGYIYIHEVESINREGRLPKQTITLVDKGDIYSVKSSVGA